MIQRLLLIATLLMVVAPTAGDERIPAEPEVRWWKGNIHTHSFWSDGNDFPEMIAEWYRTHAYHFLALSDHNVLSEGERWIRHDEVVKRGGPGVLEKYPHRFGGGWVETRGERATSSFEVRLKPLDEFRALVESRGEFLMIPGEEISDRVQNLPVHLNATNLKELIRPVGGTSVAEALANNLRAVEMQAAEKGREILLHVNHPNFGLAITAEDLAAVVNERFFEVYNGHPAVGHLGDEHHPGVEQLWDIANTLRLAEMDAPPLFGVATDDSHSYHGREGARPGHGWIQVRSRYLTPEHLIRAIKQGDFYASSGVTLEAIHFDADTRKLRLEIRDEPGVTYRTEFVGTLRDYDRTSEPRLDAAGNPIVSTRKYSSEVGQVLAFSDSLQPDYQLTGHELYVRAHVTASRAHPDPSFPDQNEQAWTQPVGWR